MNNQFNTNTSCTVLAKKGEARPSTGSVFAMNSKSENIVDGGGLSGLIKRRTYSDVEAAKHSQSAEPSRETKIRVFSQETERLVQLVRSSLKVQRGGRPQSETQTGKRGKVIVPRRQLTVRLDIMTFEQLADFASATNRSYQDILSDAAKRYLCKK